MSLVGFRRSCVQSNCALFAAGVAHSCGKSASTIMWCATNVTCETIWTTSITTRFGMVKRECRSNSPGVRSGGTRKPDGIQSVGDTSNLIILQTCGSRPLCAARGAWVLRKEQSRAHRLLRNCTGSAGEAAIKPWVSAMPFARSTPVYGITCANRQSACGIWRFSGRSRSCNKAVRRSARSTAGDSPRQRRTWSVAQSR